MKYAITVKGQYLGSTNLPPRVIRALRTMYGVRVWHHALDFYTRKAVDQFEAICKQKRVKI